MGNVDSSIPRYSGSSIKSTPNQPLPRYSHYRGQYSHHTNIRRRQQQQPMINNNDVVVPRQDEWDPFFQMIDDANSKSIFKISHSQRNAYHQMIGNCASSLNNPNSKRLRALLNAIFDLYQSSDLDAQKTIKLLIHILRRWNPRQM